MKAKHDGALSSEDVETVVAELRSAEHYAIPSHAQLAQIGAAVRRDAAATLGLRRVLELHMRMVAALEGLPERAAPLALETAMCVLVAAGLRSGVAKGGN